MPNRSKSVKQDNGSTESPVDFFVSRRDTRCGPQSEAKLVMGRHGRESTQRDHVIIGIRLMTRHQVTNPGPKTVSDVTRSLAGEQKVHQGHVFVRIAQGAQALMLLQCEESGSVVTPPQGSTTSLEFEGHTTGIVPFIEALGAVKMGRFAHFPLAPKLQLGNRLPRPNFQKMPKRMHSAHLGTHQTSIARCN
eukprot:jgi/Bigna1/127565/aug1.4_g2273